MTNRTFYAFVVLAGAAFIGYFAVHDAELRKLMPPLQAVRQITMKFAICDTRTDGTHRCVNCVLNQDCPNDARIMMMREEDGRIIVMPKKDTVSP